MPQIQLRRDDAHFNDALPVPASVRDRPYRSKPVAKDLAPAQAEVLPSGRRIDDDKMALAFERLHLVLAVAARSHEGDTAQGEALLTAANSLDILQHKAAIEGLRDPVIKCLSDALADAGRAYDPHAGIRADALRLAVAIRLLGLHAELAPSSAEQDRLVDADSAPRAGGLQKWRLKRVAEYVDSHLSNKITLSDLAAVAGLSRMHFASQFRLATGLRPHEYLLRQRIRRADEMLRQTTMTIVEIALSVGFQTQAHFTTVFKRIAGSTPAQWRNVHYAAQAAE